MPSLGLAAIAEVLELQAFSEMIGLTGQLDRVICYSRFVCHFLVSCIHSSSLQGAEDSTWPALQVIWLLSDCLVREAWILHQIVSGSVTGTSGL